MEPAGLGIGILGLTGAFTASVECFEYVQLGRQFGRDYGNSLLRLDAARLRLSRWGVAVRLGPGTHPKPQISAPEEDLKLAGHLLEQINECFEDAERVSGRFKKRAVSLEQNPESSGLLLCNADSDLDREHQRLHLNMRELALQRQKSTSIRKKAAWALYEKKRFEKLVTDVNDLINQLVDLFPATQDDQRALCTREISAIEHTRDLSLLNDVAANDQMFSAEIKKELQKRGHFVTDWKADGSSKMWIGDKNAFGVESKGHNAARFTVTDNADIHIGNINEGK